MRAQALPQNISRYAALFKVKTPVSKVVLPPKKAQFNDLALAAATQFEV